MYHKSHYFSTKKNPFFCGPHKYRSCGFHLDLGIPYLFQPWTSSRVTLSLSLYCADYLKSHKLLLPHTLINYYIFLAPTRLSLGFALDRWAQKQNNKGIPSRPTINLGPLHTRAKSRDHEIVRAPKKVSKGRPKTRPKSCSVVIGPQV